MNRHDHRGPKTQLWAIKLGGSKGLGLASAVKLGEATKCNRGSTIKADGGESLM